MERYDIGITTLGYATQELRQIRHAMEQADTRKHPKLTKQGFDFFMNLGA